MKIISYILLIYIIPIVLNFNILFADKLSTSSNSIIRTNYFDIEVVAHNFIKSQRGHGGAFTRFGHDLIMASSDGNFYNIDVNNWTFVSKYLPHIYLGDHDIHKSARYKHQELLPRINDIKYSGGFFYVSYLLYDEKKDFIYVIVARSKHGSHFWKPIYKSEGLVSPYFTLGTGGKMIIVGHRLFLTIGDFSLDRVNGLSTDIAPQNPSQPWGKIGFIDLNTFEFKNYSLGHRNPGGLLVLDNGLMISSEHGPQGGDELNIIKENANYGWPYESYGVMYGTFNDYSDSLPALHEARNFEKPLYAYVPSPAITQLIQVKNVPHQWDGDILLGSLKAKSIYHLKLITEGTCSRVIFSEQILINYRIRDLLQIDDGYYLLTDEGNILELHQSKVQY